MVVENVINPSLTYFIKEVETVLFRTTRPNSMSRCKHTLCWGITVLRSTVVNIQLLCATFCSTTNNTAEITIYRDLCSVVVMVK